jgi:tetratricopeptide (TPR) repeat protein
MRRVGISFAFVLLFAAAATPARAQDAVDRLDMRAHAAYEAQNFDLAIKYWSDALKLDPNNSTDFFNRALAHAGKNEADKALADFTEAIRLSPDDPDAYEARAEIYKNRLDAALTAGKTDQEDAGKVLADFGQLIRLKPTEEGYLMRADTYRALQMYDKAIADYGEVIRINPKYSNAYASRAATYASEEQWDKAIADLSQVIQLEPNAAYGYQLRGQAYLEKKDLDKALADADNAVRLEPENADSIALRGNIYASLGKYDKAVGDYNHIMASNPDFAEAYNAEAWLYATCPEASVRNGAKALELAQKACELTQWKVTSFIDTLAASEAECGKFDDAVKHQKQAVDTAKSQREDEWQIKDYATRIPLYEQKQPYRDAGK